MSGPWVVAFVGLWVVVLLTAAVVIGVLRRISAVLEHAEARLTSASLGGIPVASRAPDFRVYQEDGASVAGRVLRPADLIRAPTILLFMERHCPPCRTLAEELASGADQLEGVPLRVVLNEEEGRPEWLPSDVPVVYERRQEVSRAFENTATPQAYLLDPGRVVLAKRIVRSLSDLREMASTVGTERG